MRMILNSENGGLENLMKKIICTFLCLALLAGALAACGKSAESDGRLSIVTTIFPEYDWVRNILGERAGDVKLTMLLDDGVDLHSYQPTTEDMMTISSCDMFIHVGGESDKWVAGALANAENGDMVVVDLLEALGGAVKEEELKEGMETEAEEEDEAEEEGPEYDEHVWLSLKNAAALCRHIADKLGGLDPANAAAYKANADEYIAKLNALDGNYQQTVDAAAKKTLVFGDRFPFRYLTDDYGLDYFAAFKGCSAESEATFSTMIFLAGKIDELSLTAIMQIETSDGTLAETVRENTKTKDQSILTMYSLQSVTSEQVADGATYLGEMKENLKVLADALS